MLIPPIGDFFFTLAIEPTVTDEPVPVVVVVVWYRRGIATKGLFNDGGGDMGWQVIQFRRGAQLIGRYYLLALDDQCFGTHGLFIIRASNALRRTVPSIATRCARMTVTSGITGGTSMTLTPFLPVY